MLRRFSRYVCSSLRLAFDIGPYFVHGVHMHARGHCAYLYSGWRRSKRRREREREREESRRVVKQGCCGHQVASPGNRACGEARQKERKLSSGSFKPATTLYPGTLPRVCTLSSRYGKGYILSFGRLPQSRGTFPRCYVHARQRRSHHNCDVNRGFLYFPLPSLSLSLSPAFLIISRAFV